jgi:hypothetical protein
MPKFWIRLAAGILLAAFLGVAAWGKPVLAEELFQQPTSALPTVTSTPSGPMAVVIPQPETQINLRAGPNTKYDKVGVLLVGQRVPAKGRSPGGEWVLVEYPGVAGGLAWVWSAYIKIEPPTNLPIVEPPPTPTPLYTMTIDPTLAAKFIVTAAPTRLPTYTPPPPLAIPTFTAMNGSGVGNVPMGFIILGLAALGILLGLISFVQGR